MLFFRKSLLSVVLLTVGAVCAFADSDKETEETGKSKNSKGYLTGSFETNTILYHEDKKTSATVPDSHFGSNNYLKVDYYNNRFSIGLQMEAYEPVLVGYPTELQKVALTNYYVSWTDDRFSVTAGTFYEQFGSGLLFRSWEDRSLGLNNAVMGARVTYAFRDILSVKALWGLPRFGMSFSDTQVRGADLSLSLSNAIGMKAVSLALEGSVLNRYQALGTDQSLDGCKSGTTGYSARLNLEASGFFFKGEYVDAGQKYFYNFDYAGEGQMYFKKRGNAQLIETGYNGYGLGVSLSLRRLEWMNTKILNESTSTANMINYVPALCTQYTYMLTSLHPYSSRTGDLTTTFVNSGELGGQIDIFYKINKKAKIHANASAYKTIAKEGTFKTGLLLFSDTSIDWEMKWTKKFKSILLVSLQAYNPSYGADNTLWEQHIVVADLLYKWTRKISTRLELQYLNTFKNPVKAGDYYLSGDGKGDWMAAYLEVNFAPAWSIYVSDMFNHGGTKVNYYNGGVAYTKSRTRVALNYGRYKAGYICSGGVCRQIPAYTGLNLTVTTSF